MARKELCDSITGELWFYIQVALEWKVLAACHNPMKLHSDRVASAALREGRWGPALRAGHHQNPIYGSWWCPSPVLWILAGDNARQFIFGLDSRRLASVCQMATDPRLVVIKLTNEPRVFSWGYSR